MKNEYNFKLMWKLKNMNWFAATIIYLGFFALIGGTIYLTKSATPLWALLLAPTIESKKESKSNKTTEDEKS